MFPTVVPYLYYPDAAEALDFLVEAFGFEVQSEVRDPDGVVWTAQLRTGDGLVMIGPGLEEFGTRAVPSADDATSRTHVLVSDLDGHFERARAAGATVISEPAVHFGDVRIYLVADCGGQQWIFAEPIAPGG